MKFFIAPCDMNKGWVAIIFWVARTHLGRPNVGAPHLQPKVVALHTRTLTFCKLPFFSTIFQHFFNIF
jgi:hypothetical protein